MTDELVRDLRAALDALQAAARENAWDSAHEAAGTVGFLAWVLGTELSGWPGGEGELAACITARSGGVRTPAEIEKQAREDLTDRGFRYFLALLDWNDEEELARMLDRPADLDECDAWDILPCSWHQAAALAWQWKRAVSVAEEWVRRAAGSG
jgi:hypothetical protein